MDRDNAATIRRQSSRTAAGGAQYGIALLLTFIASVLGYLAFEPLEHRYTFITFFPAVVIAAWLGGAGPGIFATAVSGLASLWILAPTGNFTIGGAVDFVAWLGFLAIGVMISMLMGSMDRTRRARLAVHESQQRFTRMADSAPVMIWIAGTDKRRTWFNRPWLEFTGRTMEQELGYGWAKGVHPDDLENCLETYSVAFETRQPLRMEYRLRRHDGEYRWLLANGVPLSDDGGQFVGYIASCVDITDRKQAEAEREHLLSSERAARSEAERASRMKDEFLATLSHELRTPLNAILGWSQLLRTGRASQADLNQGLETIERNARVQAQLIEDLLDMSRIISGKLRLDAQRVELPPVVNAAIETVRPAAEAKRIELSSVFDVGVSPVWGDPARLQQIIWNLLSNAIKFTPAHGKVDVSVRQFAAHVNITVKDTGDGIKPEFLPYVFERFRQADASTTRKFGGLGLGLAIVRHLTELHGGTVQAESAGDSMGSKFSVTLPVMSLESSAARISSPMSAANRSRGLEAPALADSPTLRGLTVLVVDDDPDARDLIRRLLEERGADVVVAGSAGETLQALDRAVPDVLISDISMPGRDGYTLIKQIRERDSSRGGRVPAAALTAFARPEDRARAMLAGYQAHIPKPVEPAELAAVVASLSGRTGSPAAVRSG